MSAKEEVEGIHQTLLSETNIAYEVAEPWGTVRMVVPCCFVAQKRLLVQAAAVGDILQLTLERNYERRVGEQNMRLEKMMKDNPFAAHLQTSDASDPAKG